MPLRAGDRLGPFEILAPIGAGGMGEVYKARDTRLDRIVAIKISAEQFTERFEQEARAVAALNHPNICTLHDVGPNYLVMEYVEGTPLKGPLPAAKAVEYGNQILDALDAAHRKGITHRDLKPDNIMVAKQGIKLLDFGLAKRATPLAESDATQALTSQGQIAGTLQYMSPEQLQGKEIDTRSDLFAFGCVLYELLTGKRAFQGQNAASVVAAILEREPAPLTAAPPLDRVVRRSLAKDPDQRFQTARDLKAALAWAMEQPPLSAPRKASRPWIWMAATVALAVLSLALIWRGRPAAPAEMVTLSINPPENTLFSNPNFAIPVPEFALSPDGRSIAFVAGAPGARPTLWVRPLIGTEARQLAGTEDAQLPFWSPDMNWLGFFAEGKLKKILVSGGPAQTLAEITQPRGGSWDANDVILFSPFTGAIQRTAASGGLPTSVPLPEGHTAFPSFLPDGGHFLALDRTAEGNGFRGVVAFSLDGKSSKPIVPKDSNAAYAPPGYLLYLDADVLIAQPFDADRLELTGQPHTLATGVGHSGAGNGAFSVSQAGTLAYSGPILQSGRLTWFGRDGERLGWASSEGQYTDFRLSPDEKRLAATLVEFRTGTLNIWITDLARGSMTRLSGAPRQNANAVWSPDGSRIYFRTTRSGSSEIYRKSAGGGGNEDVVVARNSIRATADSAAGTLGLSDVSPDGHYALMYGASPGSGGDLWQVPLDGGADKPALYIQAPLEQMHGNFSPDGKLVAYSSNESGKFQVYVQTFPRTDRVWQVSTTGGYEPRWRADGTEIYYLSDDRKLMAVPVSKGPAFGVPKTLFQTRVPPGVSHFRTDYVASRDGKRFLVNTLSGDPAPNPITIVLNWPAGLKK